VQARFVYNNACRLYDEHEGDSLADVRSEGGTAVPRSTAGNARSNISIRIFLYKPVLNLVGT
jgi:hypothetical protein